MIIETSCNRFYRVTETQWPHLDHVWNGVEVKFDKKRGKWTDKTNRAGYPKSSYVRKAASRVVEA